MARLEIVFKDYSKIDIDLETDYVIETTTTRFIVTLVARGKHYTYDYALDDIETFKIVQGCADIQEAVLE